MSSAPSRRPGFAAQTHWCVPSPSMATSYTLMTFSPGHILAKPSCVQALSPPLCPLSTSPALCPAQPSLRWPHGDAHCKVLQTSGHSHHSPSPSEGHSSCWGSAPETGDICSTGNQRSVAPSVPSDPLQEILRGLQPLRAIPSPQASTIALGLGVLRLLLLPQGQSSLPQADAAGKGF